MRRKSVIFWCALTGILLAASTWFLLGFRVSALQRPVRGETFLATTALDWFVGRESLGPLPPAPEDTPANVSTGKTMFINQCSLCHGTYGRRPTQIGQSLYPPAPPLDTAQAQQWTNRELFWIIKHGIRNTGMPGFALIHSNREIWQLVYYIRSLGKTENKTVPGD